MSSEFSNFILTERLKTRALVSLNQYDVQYKHEVLKSVSGALLAAWKQLIKHSKIHAPKEAIEDAHFQSNKACTELYATNFPTKLHAAVEHGKVSLVSPVLLIPLILIEHDRQLIRKAALDAAAQVFSELKNKWHEIFSHETESGKIISDFHISQDHHSVMFHLTHKDGEVVHRVSLFHVTIENGKVGSKVRDHDTVYLNIDR